MLEKHVLYFVFLFGCSEDSGIYCADIFIILFEAAFTFLEVMCTSAITCVNNFDFMKKTPGQLNVLECIISGHDHGTTLHIIKKKKKKKKTGSDPH